MDVSTPSSSAPRTILSLNMTMFEFCLIPQRTWPGRVPEEFLPSLESDQRCQSGLTYMKLYKHQDFELISSNPWTVKFGDELADGALEF